ncbi:hypothetical protein LTR91_001930 [Friedmanniomyces endolithicus]|uniref:3-hydroxyisobutyrate dehydrogenase n=1 Tax=Friedmanniomyces endolithicus TaxID=329885 RepID=A0AAN6L2U2_9PEZI|nr:hypothetical protein LTR94_023631 [Friedmanniomyces endolithicus]KAK0815455.1 hypothetical protein LTR59_000528 [Friedmanniomyces endolithicus]KAK0818243.1 hypothetical protein LTR38_001290 [Friedmanniomyces endolithicus]KAK0819419.1 hypothetical protein LTR75_002188 [Friedmanniomyces endolithicus]KAK0844021.1 hypothetical protein LTR03_008349 [Friedmanniomyces endolithicus]
MADLPKNIGWIGLGAMGYPIATNLLKKMSPDTQFHVYDVVQASVDKFVEDGAGRVHACMSSKEVTDKSDLILSMVPEGSHVRAVYLDPSTGVLASPSLSNPKLLIDCSTIDPATSLAVRSALTTQHPLASFIDTPVSGGVLGAQKATLTFMLGCSEMDPHLPLLQALLGLMGGNLFPCGGPSLGLTAKLCNNYCSSLITLATCEAMNLGIASGMDPRVLANIFHTSTAQSAIADDWNPVPGLCPEAPASRGYVGGFRVGLMAKDVGLAVESAEAVGVELVLGRVGLGVYRKAAGDERYRELDSRVVYRVLGGREDWRGDFPGEVGMRRDETRRLVRRARGEGL